MNACASAVAILRHVGEFAAARRMPSRRGLAAAGKLHGYRVERRWPFLHKASAATLNLGFDDVLAFQYARSRPFVVLVIGAYDGVENDPLSKFMAEHECCGVFVEPQRAAFARLSENLRNHLGVHLVNAAVDRIAGTRELFYVPDGIDGLPKWTEQLASFRKQHIAKHEDRVPGLSNHVASTMVKTISFDDLIDQFSLRHIDVLQIDAEGADALLLSWFPFSRVKPGVLHYEIAHMSDDEVEAARTRLRGFGYSLYPTESPTDEMAVLI